MAGKGEEYASGIEFSQETIIPAHFSIYSYYLNLISLSFIILLQVIIILKKIGREL
jgi:hypothetical protein